MNTIVLVKTNEWGSTLLIDGKKVVMRVGDLFVDGKVIHKCNFCGRSYDQDEYVSTMCEQAPQRDPSYFRSTGSKYCGLYCAWLNDPNMYRVCGKEKVEKMKEDVAKRVAKYMKGGEVK